LHPQGAQCEYARNSEARHRYTRPPGNDGKITAISYRRDKSATLKHTEFLLKTQ
jgi:hypothetical protein